MTGEDPASTAASAPEPADARSPVHALGVGPGSPEYLTGRTRDLLDAADIVVGFSTVIDVVRPVTDATLLECSYDDQEDTLAAFADRVSAGGTGVAVLMGDPSVSGYQFLGRIERAVDRPVRVVPGVSSIQVAAARARTPLESTTFVTLHRRGPPDAALDRLVRDVGDRHLLVLPRPYDLMPPDVATHLLDAGADPGLSALVGERLTLADERITRTTLGDLATVEAAFSDLSVLVVRRG
ncbi:cobalt-precorrin-7 (C(5))-methyltransferase [Salinirubellus sp. GCM10025818]|uniref:cobalt-precorrin-7 (C(5))-methyltransferase n=1 Tax=Salinirubellus TaxID=2162630 RepID=UPI0030CA9397